MKCPILLSSNNDFKSRNLSFKLLLTLFILQNLFEITTGNVLTNAFDSLKSLKSPSLMMTSQGKKAEQKIVRKLRVSNLTMVGEDLHYVKKKLEKSDLIKFVAEKMNYWQQKREDALNGGDTAKAERLTKAIDNLKKAMKERAENKNEEAKEMLVANYKASINVDETIDKSRTDLRTLSGIFTNCRRSRLPTRRCFQIIDHISKLKNMRHEERTSPALKIVCISKKKDFKDNKGALKKYIRFSGHRVCKNAQDFDSISVNLETRVITYEEDEKDFSNPMLIIRFILAIVCIFVGGRYLKSFKDNLRTF